MMNKKMKFIKTILPVVALLVLAAVAYASGEGGEEHGGGSHIMGTVWQVINFAVLVAILVVAMKKADLKGLLRKRSEDIQKNIEEARQAKEMAQKALAEVEERLKLKDQEIEKIISAARASGEREREETEESAKNMSEMLLEQARTNIEFELEQARAAIKAEAVELAMELARQKISDRMTPEEQKKLIEESLAKLEGKN
jgi:F-type H+-transporting ATPase subunit b